MRNSEMKLLPVSGHSKEYEAWLSKAAWCGLDIRFAPKHIRNDKKVVMTAVQQNGKALEFASPELQKDKEVVFAAVNQNGKALEFASPNLQNDKEIVMAAIYQTVEALPFASPQLRNDKEIISEANQSGSKYAFLELKDNIERSEMLTPMRMDKIRGYHGTSGDGLPWGRNVSETGRPRTVFRSYQTGQEPAFRHVEFPPPHHHQALNGTQEYSPGAYAYRFGMPKTEIFSGPSANVNRPNLPFATEFHFPETNMSKSDCALKQVIAEPSTGNTEDDKQEFVNIDIITNHNWDMEQLAFDRLDPYFPLEMIKMTIEQQQVKVALVRMQDCFQKLCIQAELTNNPAGAKLRTMEHIELYVVFFEHENGDLAVDIQRRQGDYMKCNQYIRQILDAAKGIPIQESVVATSSTFVKAQRIHQFESFLDRCVSPSPACSSSSHNDSSPWAIEQTPEESLRSSLDNIYYSLTSNRLDERKSGLNVMTIFTDLKKTMSYMAINISLVVVGGVSPVDGYEQTCRRIHEVLVRILMKQDFVGDDTNMFSDMNSEISPFLSSDSLADNQTLPGERPCSRYYDQYMMEIRHIVLGIFANSLEVLQVFNDDQARGSKYEMTDAVSWLKGTAELIGEHDGLGVVETLMDIVCRAKRGPSDAYLACKVLRYLLSVDHELRTGFNKRNYHSHCQALKKAMVCGSRNAKLFSEAKRLDELLKQR